LFRRAPWGGTGGGVAGEKVEVLLAGAEGEAMAGICWGFLNRRKFGLGFVLVGWRVGGWFRDRFC